MDRKNFKILFKSDSRGYSLLLTNKNRGDSCILESNIIASLDESDTSKIRQDYTKLVDCFACIGILELLKNVKYLIAVISAEWITKLNETDIFKIGGVQFINMSGDSRDPDPEIGYIHKLLESGSFYFGKGNKGKAVDISTNVQNSYFGKTMDSRFIWNKYLIAPFIDFGISVDWFNGIICGSFLANTVYSSTAHIKICVISRVSCQRVGTRFQTRGVDDNGNVANFIETEQCFLHSDGSIMTSYIQIRGSVPLFWEQPSLQIGSHKIKFSRNYEMSSIAYEKHFQGLKDLYNRILIVNLLGSREGERNLSARFLNCHKESFHNDDVKFIAFDYHREMSSKTSSNISKLKSQITEFVEEGHFCWIINGEMVQKQYGSIRTNCVDCLDRTNAVQTMIGCDLILEKQLNIMIPNQKSKLNSVLENFKTMWKTNGDNVSMIYAGSGALGAGSKLYDAQKSVKRTYQANFSDSFKQRAMLKLLKPNYLINEDYFRMRQIFPENIHNMDARCLSDLLITHNTFTDIRKLRVFVGTWNVNGGKNFHSIAYKHESVTDWLLNLMRKTKEENPEMLDPSADLDIITDIFAIGFQEIVDLTASNIMSAKSVNQQHWAQFLREKISDVTDYVLLSTIQLVGICLFVFLKAPLAPFVSELSTSSVKTGFKGTAGNKGAVGIRFQLFNSSFCFVCSHFAAGQSNFKERNEDYEDIVKQLNFSRDRSIGCHDFIFWCGDFNYRIDLPNNDVKYLIANKNWAQLEQSDQLFIQHKHNNVFKGFKEDHTSFAPTYKYDLFCDDYDTSEKCRVPAWTDRILWKINMPTNSDDSFPCKQLMYNRAELKTSDHRPVASIFDVNAIQINKEYHKSVFEVLKKYGPRNAIVRVQIKGFSKSSDIPNELLNLIIEIFGRIGQIVLVRFFESYVLLNFSDSKFAVEAISKFDNTTLENTDYLVRVKPFDDNWEEDIRNLVNEYNFDKDTPLPKLMLELIKNTKGRQSILHKEEFYNEDEDDIKPEGDRSHRARSCSPPKESVHDEQFLNPHNLGEQTSSCLNLLEKTVIDTTAPKRPPPLRPPPINKSDINISDSTSKKNEMEEDLLGLFGESDSNQTDGQAMFFLNENNSSASLHPPLIPVKSSGDRPLPPVPQSVTSEAEVINRAINRPLPRIPNPPQINADIPLPVIRKKKNIQ